MANRIELYLVDEDTAYLDRLAIYLIRQKNMFELHAFSSLEKAEDALRAPGLRVDILAVSERMDLEALGRTPAKVKIVLSEQDGGAAPEGYPYLNKFQKTESLVTQMLQAYEKATGQIQRSAKAQAARVFGVYSPAGGVGKTTAALLLARALAGRGVRTFYFSAEHIASFERNGPQGVSLSNVLLALQEKKSNLELQIRANIVEDGKHGIQMFAAPESTLEWNEVGGDAARRLLEALASMGLAEAVVLDLDGELHAEKTALLGYCDRILVPVSEEDGARRKAEALRRELELHAAELSALAGRMVYVQNKARTVDAETIPFNAAYASLEQCMDDAPIPPVLLRLAQEWMRG